MPSFHKSCQWKIINTAQNTTLAENAKVADTFISRLCGLIPESGLAEGEGLIITRCKSIHMIGMRFAIDAVFVDKNDVVTGLIENIRPWRFSPTFWKSSYVIELPVGTIQKARLEPGHTLEFFAQKTS